MTSGFTLLLNCSLLGMRK